MKKPLRAGGGARSKALTSGRVTIAQLEARIAELEQSRKLAETSNQAKGLFLANVIHELRTPMNAILGYAQLLRRAADIPKRHHHAIETIEKSGGHLLALINDVLDLSKIEAGCMDLQVHDFDLNALLYDLSAMFDIRSAQKNLHWRVEIWHPPNSPLVQIPSPPSASTNDIITQATLWSDPQLQMQGWRLLVHGDERKLRQILINLLSNAVNFTEQGEVVLRVVLPFDGTDAAQIGSGSPLFATGAAFIGGSYHFEVRDTGPGIAEEAQASIFQAFHQGAEAVEKGGTGLGLTIARRLIALMGGELHLESQPGVGSRFFFKVPLAAGGSGRETPRLNEAATLDYAHLKLPGQLHERLKATAEIYSTTEFKLCLRELEQLGRSEKLLADRFRALLQSYDMQAILNVLAAIATAP